MSLEVFVLDDASSDGTSEAIAEQFPEVTVLQSIGQLYWNGAMARLRRAIAGDYDLCADTVGTTKETVPIPELIKDQNDAAPVARR